MSRYLVGLRGTKPRRFKEENSSWRCAELVFQPELLRALIGVGDKVMVLASLTWREVDEIWLDALCAFRGNGGEVFFESEWVHSKFEDVLPLVIPEFASVDEADDWLDDVFPAYRPPF